MATGSSFVTIFAVFGIPVSNMTRENGISGSNRTRDMFHPLCLNSARYWRRLRNIHQRVDASFADRGRAISFVSPLMAPMLAAENLVYGHALATTPITHPPVFVIGHWRSGTTLLHNLLTQDPQFGFVSLFQTLAPGAFLVGRRTVQPILALRAPETRPMDNVKIRMHFPSEEEFALAHMCPQSAYVGWYFPNDYQELFTKYALMERISSEDKREWAAAYREMLTKATIAFGGRRVVLKSPTNTARVHALLNLFPGAKFVHIHRNPYDIFRSTLHLFREVLKTVTLQDISDARIQEYVLDFYPRMMQAYWDQRDAIPAGNHAEVRYDDLVADPLAELERIYGELGLPGWSAAIPHMEHFLGKRSEFKENEYTHTPSHAALVEEHWACAFDRLGYERTGRRTAFARA